MITLLSGAIAVALVWWMTKQFAGANPVVLARLVKRVGGTAALGLAALLMVRGRFDMALVAGSAAAWLFGWSGGLTLPGMGPRRSKAAGSVSRVRSAMVEMELDHDNGTMTGTVLAGALAGRSLNDLPAEQLSQLYRECERADPDGVRLLEAYLDRRFPGWREDAQGNRDPRSHRDGEPGPMTEQEAYQILGLGPGAGLEEIRRAHRALMKKLHPDQGGSTYLASRINEAKDVLTSRHR